MQGQAGFFFRNKIKIPFAIKRYIEETERLYSVIEDCLKAGNGWLVGNKFSVADINAFTWVSSYPMSGIDMKPFPRTLAWVNTIAQRQGTLNGLKVPNQRNLPNEETAAATRKQVQEYIAEADKQIAAAN